MFYKEEFKSAVQTNRHKNRQTWKQTDINKRTDRQTNAQNTTNPKYSKNVL